MHHHSGEQEKEDGGWEGLGWGVGVLRLQPGGALKLSPRAWDGGWGQTTHPPHYSPREKGKISPQRYADVFKLRKESWPGAHSLRGWRESSCPVVALRAPSQAWGSPCHQGRKKRGRTDFPVLGSLNSPPTPHSTGAEAETPGTAHRPRFPQRRTFSWPWVEDKGPDG